MMETKRMGRPKKKIDEEALLTMRGEGKHLKEISSEMGVSIPTLSRRIAELQHKKGVLTKYREILGLHLTMHQVRLLEAITPEKVERASLLELIKAYDLLVRLEKKTEGKDSFKIFNLVDHLLFLEKFDEFCALQDNEPARQ